MAEVVLLSLDVLARPGGPCPSRSGGLVQVRASPFSTRAEGLGLGGSKPPTVEEARYVGDMFSATSQLSDILATLQLCVFNHHV